MAVATLAQSTRDCFSILGRSRRSGLTSQSVSAITKLPGCANMLTRNWFIQARSKAAAISTKKIVSSKKARIRISINSQLVEEKTA